MIPSSSRNLCQIRFDNYTPFQGKSLISFEFLFMNLGKSRYVLTVLSIYFVAIDLFISSGDFALHISSD